MKTRDFFFDLPPELIAQHPPETRGESRMMTVDRRSGRIGHGMVRDLPDLLPPGTLAVFNDSRVRKARLFGRAGDTGGRAEFLLLKSPDGLVWRVMSNRRRRLVPGRVFLFPEGLEAVVTDGAGNGPLLRFSRPVTEEYLDRCGHVPLPPYIRREDEPRDAERYQTVYARVPGSVASPTAGLHFTPEILGRMDRRGIRRLTVTLHVGPGTFLPVRSENIEDHVMHREDYSLEPVVAEEIAAGKARGVPILAVGTTSVRVLESSWGEGGPVPGSGSTEIFIYPGYRFRGADMIFTNFHVPRSTLFMLVCAFGGTDLMRHAYREAVREGYRFFSYGDGMLIF